MQHYWLEHSDFQLLLDNLHHFGYQCVGPKVVQNNLLYDTITTADDLPLGYTIIQSPGKYTLVNEGHQRYFKWSNTSQGIKPWLFKPVEPLWQASISSDNKLDIEEYIPTRKPVAFIGARACDCAALQIHDQHFLAADYTDTPYAHLRESILIIAIECDHPSDTCFCASTNDGPALDNGYDIGIYELEDGLIVSAKTSKGEKIVNQMAMSPVDPDKLIVARNNVEQAARRMQRQIPAGNLFGVLIANASHSQWDAISDRCLACGNCTAVCPTCYCYKSYDQPSLSMETSTHVREWSSCFSSEHSYIHGLQVRNQTAQRYRQWLTHKFGSWHEQYGRSGCTGCGRCISWCPVGIDVTEELGIITREPVDENQST